MKRSYQWILLSCILIAGFYPEAVAQVQWNSTVNTGTYSSAIGYQTQSTNNYSFAAGQLSKANGIASIALGYNSTAFGNSSVAIGQSNYAALQSYAIGQNAIANGQQSLAIGRFVETGITGMNSIILGSSVSGQVMRNNIPASLMIGFNSIVPTLFVGPSPDYKSSGNVGIGTTAPTQKLDIDGNIRLRNNSIIGTWSNNSLTFNTNSAARMVIAATGNVGIGTNTPNTRMHVAGDVTIEGLSNPKGDQIVTSDRNGKLMLIPVNFSGDNLGNHIATQNLDMKEFSIRNSTREAYQTRADGSRYFAGLRFSEENSMVLETGKKAVFTAVAATNNASGLWVANWACGGYGLVLNADNRTGGIYYDNNDPKLSIGFNSSKVGIGLIPPSDGAFRLYVEGGILAEEVKVMLKSAWPDYVFSADHKLPGINEVADFITANGHLPGVPSAATVAAEGIELGQMNALLLTKIVQRMA
ncbi:MAG: hypothetical protein RBS07_05525 [Lentimicrobium sp.]|jgi:hypothetical protein|nr:hypothetical protein [Lentimicrobium sp.]